MKTISGHCVSVKDISLSKAAKVLSKFVSADNGASHVINAYLHRASASFNELNQLHKELESSHSHKKKHKQHRTGTGTDSGRVVENSVRSVDVNKELSLGHVKFNEFRRQQTGSGNTDQDDEKPTQTIVKFSQELNGSIGYQRENVGGSEKHKKKKKQQEVESLHDRDSTVKFGEREGDGKPPTGAQNEIESGREQGNEGDVNPGMEEGKKQKSAKKKHKVSTSSFSNNKGEVENAEGGNGKGLEQQEDIEKSLCNSVECENGGLGGSLHLQIKKKKKAGSENKLYAKEVKMEQNNNRKSDDVEGRPEDRTRDLTKKRMKRKHSSDT
ncbi:transcriptional regulator ATRX-like isoform X1 [Spatholobus suberectus]|nr:transcriptional regulator ATRX-like isoform X1 [Spatholobus suberectus]